MKDTTDTRCTCLTFPSGRAVEMLNCPAPPSECRSTTGNADLHVPTSEELDLRARLRDMERQNTRLHRWNLIFLSLVVIVALVGLWAMRSTDTPKPAKATPATVKAPSPDDPRAWYIRAGKESLRDMVGKVQFGYPDGTVCAGIDTKANEIAYATDYRMTAAPYADRGRLSHSLDVDGAGREDGVPAVLSDLLAMAPAATAPAYRVTITCRTGGPAR